MCQAITWTNDDPVFWYIYIYTSPSLRGLTLLTFNQVGMHAAEDNFNNILNEYTFFWKKILSNIIPWILVNDLSPLV